MKNTPFDLTGKVAVITGSSRGIGRSSAELLAKLGAKVVISSRKADACEEVADGIRKAGGDAHVIACNISRQDEVEALIAGATKHYGKVDILVCNAAVNPYYGPLLDITDEAFDKIMGSNVKSNIWLCAQAIPQMAERGNGSVVIISSIGGLRGSTVIGAYGISKAADFCAVPQPCRRMGPEGRPRQLRRARPGQDRFRPRAVGRRSPPEAPLRHHAAAPHRRTRRDRRRRGLSRLRCLELHDRPDHRGRRRRDHGVGVVSLSSLVRERRRDAGEQWGPRHTALRCYASRPSPPGRGGAILTILPNPLALRATQITTPGSNAMSMSFVLAIDQGTTSSRAIVFRATFPSRRPRSRNSRSIFRPPAGSSTSRRTSGPRPSRPAARR